MHGSLLKAMIDCHAGILLESLVLTGMASGQYSRKSSHGHVRQSENVMLKMILWTDILTTSHRVCMCVKGAMARWTLTTHEWMKRTGKCVRWRTRESLSSATCTRYHLIFFYTYRSNPYTCYCHYKQLYDVMFSGCVVECQIWNREVADSNLARATLHQGLLSLPSLWGR